MFYRLSSCQRGSVFKFTIISSPELKRLYLIYTSGITMAVGERSKILPVIRVEMKDLVYIQVILNGRALKPHPALLCISISWLLCSEIIPISVGPQLFYFQGSRTCTEHTVTCTVRLQPGKRTTNESPKKLFDFFSQQLPPLLTTVDEIKRNNYTHF